MSNLFVIGMPLDGIFKDLTEYTKQTIKNADFVIGEERKSTHRVLASCDERDKEYFLLNEHSKKIDFSLIDNIKEANSVCFFSDAGTPCVADPGYKFIDACYNEFINIISIPGPSSIMAALSISGFYAEKFYFAGFPPREKINRKNFYNKILKSKETIVLFERPYALNKIIEDLQNIKKRLSISFNLGMPNEKTFRGYFEDISPKITNIKKQPFVVVIEGKNER